MSQIIQQIESLYKEVFDTVPDSVEKIPQSGSDRVYYRVVGPTICIATTGKNVKENQTFLKFSEHFKKSNSPVPAIYIVSDDEEIYLQEDFGDVSLLDQLQTHGYNDHVYGLFKQSLQQLANMQIKGHVDFNYDWCITSREFGRQAILSDLLYFRYYFLDTLKIPYDKEKLQDDFEDLSIYLTRVEHKYFMFRDFQSRNVMVKEGKVHFIDYQGGMKGAVQYDV
ncbi:MAG TPA: phosphotransferase, partial [Lacibacter sp.]|nr:phosphotransferase [Lacibacter sp.]